LSDISPVLNTKSGPKKKAEVSLVRSSAAEYLTFVAAAGDSEASHDGVLARDEMKAEVAKTMTGGDSDKDGRLSTEENNAGVRTAFGGFAKQHAKEVDADGDGFITAAELESIALRMFDKADSNRDGKLAGEEVALPPGYQPTPPAPKRP
jgi:hypothetical protein